jgi:RNase H-like domain found in reverse transcriptase/Reverse transcriptase (RNA-dependent DNA polymerase)
MPEEQVELDKFLKENLDKGYIKLSQSPMASPFFFVKKKDGKLWPCQDYRYLNDWTVKNAYPLPLISKIMDKIKGTKFFTKFNVRWGYNNIRIKAEDQWKAAFKTNRGLFEPTVMFFRMCNSPATFQAMMDSIFSDMIEGQKVIVYMDDILIFAESQKELQERIKQVLQQLREHDLFLKPKKCEFNKSTMEYLGLIIQEGKLSMDPVKLSGIRDWPTLTSVKQVQGFIGFANFYRRFIKKFSKLVLPLNNLLQKDTKFDWNDQCQEAFKTLKGRFLQEPMLMMLDHSKPFQIESDASKYASGAVLTQTDINGDRHPVAFLSKTFTDMERRYEIYDRELLGIVWALKEWRHYIQRSGHTTLIHTDHQNLTYFWKAQKLSDRQARWSLFLSEFDIKLQHLPGNKMILSDALSRRPDHCPEEDEMKEEILLLDDLFLNLLIST